MTELANNPVYCEDPQLKYSGDNVYLDCYGSGYVNKVIVDETTGVITLTPLDGDVVEVQDSYTNNGYTALPNGYGLRISTIRDFSSVCGDGTIELPEICDSDIIQCSDVNSNYTSGTATCKTDCSGYDETTCQSDGW